MANKKQNVETEITEEVVDQEPKKVEEPKKIQDEGKKLFSAAKEGGTRVS